MLLALLTGSGNSCKKKITKYPFPMEGAWYGVSTGCEFMLVIKSNSTGKLNSLGGHFCNAQSIGSGKIRYQHDRLIVDDEKFDITMPPESTANDSVFAPEAGSLTLSNRKFRQTDGKMQLSDTENATLITFYKYSDY